MSQYPPHPLSPSGPRIVSRPSAGSPLDAPAPYPRTPLDADERARAVANFVPLVAQSLVERGRFEISADTLEMVELWEAVAHDVSVRLRRPVVSYANGRRILIGFPPEEAAISR